MDLRAAAGILFPALPAADLAQRPGPYPDVYTDRYRYAHANRHTNAHTDRYADAHADCYRNTRYTALPRHRGELIVRAWRAGAFTFWTTAIAARQYGPWRELADAPRAHRRGTGAWG